MAFFHQEKKNHMKLMPSRRQMAVYLFSGWISFEQFALVLAWTGFDAVRMRERKRYLVRRAAISVVDTKIWNTQMHGRARSMAAKPHWKREVIKLWCGQRCAQCKDCQLQFEWRQTNELNNERKHKHIIFCSSDTNEPPKKKIQFAKRDVYRFESFLINLSALQAVCLS